MVPIGESFETHAGPDDGSLGSLPLLWAHNRVFAPRTLPEMVTSASEAKGTHDQV